MEQKRVSFVVAKAIKEAGYPFEYATVQDTINGKSFHEDGGDFYLYPTYIDIWIWLWREKDIKFVPYPIYKTGTSSIKVKGLSISFNKEEYSDPEAAIIAAIEYLVEHNLIK